MPKNIDGLDVSLDRLCREEPEWAANRNPWGIIEPDGLWAKVGDDLIRLRVESRLEAGSPFMFRCWGPARAEPFRANNWNEAIALAEDIIDRWIVERVERALL